MSYAMRAADGGWIEIVGDFEVGEVRYPAGWPDLVDGNDRAAIGVVAIVEIDAPTGVRLLGSDLGDLDGVPTRRWLTGPFTASERRAEVDIRAAAAFQQGFAPPHPAFAGERLQVRDIDDRTNWLTSQAAYAAAVAQGFGDVVDATFRTAADRIVTVSYADGLAVLLGMAGWGRAIMERSWALKDAITASDAVDLEQGWPA